jgi:hypothetical protein
MENNKIKVETYEFKRVKKTDVDVTIPTEPIFYQEYNCRVVIGIFPIYQSWDDTSKIWKLDIVRITNEDILIGHIHTTPTAFSDVLSRLDMKGKSSHASMIDDVVVRLVKYYESDRITETIFKEKYRIFKTKIEELL